MPECKLPQSIKSEKAILGAILLDNSAYLEAVEGLSSEDFALDSHRRIFARMVTLMETGRPVDIITLVDELDVHKDLQAVGDVGYVSSLLDGVPDRPSILHYVQIVRDKAILRGLIRVSQVAIERASAQNDGAMNILADAESAIAHIAAKPKSDAKSLKQLMAPTLDQMFRERTRETEFIGIPTGLHDLDQCLGGIREAEFWVTGGLSARGKTSFGVQFAMNAVRQDHPTMDFSLEMTNQQVVRRILAANTPAGAAGARDPKWISEKKWQQVLEHASQLATLPLWIDDSAALTLRELGARTRLYKKKFGIKLVLVDYLRLVDAHGQDLRGESHERRQGISFSGKRRRDQYCGALPTQPPEGHQ
jgi:replicative DNA helicase